MQSSTRQRNLRGHGALLRDEILTAATRVIDEADTEAEVSLRRIAREAGIAAPSVYAHFQDRDEVVEAVAEASWVQVAQEIAERVQISGDARERLFLGCQVYVSFAERYPLRYALMTQAAHTPPAARQVLDNVTRRLVACCGAAPQLALADVPEPDRDSARIAVAFSVALHGVAMLHRTDSPNLWLSDFSTDQVLRTLIDAAILQLENLAP